MLLSLVQVDLQKTHVQKKNAYHNYADNTLIYSSFSQNDGAKLNSVEFQFITTRRMHSCLIIDLQQLSQELDVRFSSHNEE